MKRNVCTKLENKGGGNKISQRNNANNEMEMNEFEIIDNWFGGKNVVTEVKNHNKFNSPQNI